VPDGRDLQGASAPGRLHAGECPGFEPDPEPGFMCQPFTVLMATMRRNRPWARNSRGPMHKPDFITRDGRRSERHAGFRQAVHRDGGNRIGQHSAIPRTVPESGGPFMVPGPRGMSCTRDIRFMTPSQKPGPCPIPATA